MTYEYELIKKAKCGIREKEKCRKLIDAIVHFSETARREGLLALEDRIGEIDSEFLKLGLRLVVEGTEPETVRGIMETGIYMQGKKGRNLLEQFIILEGILAIQQGEKPDIISLKLFSLLGDAGDRMRKETETEKLEAFKKFLEDLKAPPAAGKQDTDPAWEVFGRIDGRSIQKILREIDTELLALALKGAGSAVKAKVFANLSFTAGMHLYEEIIDVSFVAEERTSGALDLVRNTFARLEEQGEITYL
ncbi:MAG: hypothetical protein E4H36_06690 [Spirochaetales bacterium]|nr:MAG: hypothetical protein E4H36_06690 [Spirochaetales bacterium]